MMRQRVPGSCACLQSIQTSFVMRKLTGDLDNGMGELMPNGGHPLSAGMIEFIRQWIAYGAPQTGSVADPSLFTDIDDGSQQPLVALPVPASDSGFQLHMPPFDIQPGTEREIFRYVNNPNTNTVYLRSMDVRMREGSDHFVLWNVNSGKARTQRWSCFVTVRTMR